VAWLVQRAFDRCIPQGNSHELLQLSLALLVLRFGSGLSAYLCYSKIHALVRRFTARLRERMLEQVFLLPRSFYREGEAGRISELLIADSERSHQMVLCLLAIVVPNSLLALALAFALLYLDSTLFAIMLVVWPFTWIANEYFRRQAHGATREFNSSFRSFSLDLRWLLESLDFVRLHNSEEKEKRNQRDHIESVRRTSLPLGLLQVGYIQLQTILLTALSLVILLAGGAQVAAQQLSLGELIAFYAVVGMLNQALREIAQGLYHVVIGWESWGDCLEFLGHQERSPYQGSEEIQLNSSLELRNVTFGYAEQPLLDQVDLRLLPGQRVALVGPNGCGKSTLMGLLLGFLKPQRGQLLADGVPYEQLDLGQLRRQLGVVPQEPLLFAASIRDNVAYSRPEATCDEIWQALEKAAAADWVRQLPQGLETRVGDRAVLLSGGQRQRLAIARALLGRPRFLLLDEPTNHLDEKAIRQLMENLAQLEPAPALLLITHDESVAARADAILRLGQESEVVA
jgi:ATP-binding cassette subfamily B protein